MSPQTATLPAVGRIQCHDCPEIHEARYVGPNDWGQEVYSVVCGEYVERYTSEVLLPAIDATDRPALERLATGSTCPTCTAGPAEYCQAASGQPVTVPHPARVEAAAAEFGLAVPPAPEALALVIDGITQYVDPYPGRKGTDRIIEPCDRCGGAGSVSWGADFTGAVRDANGRVREVPKVCFECDGIGTRSFLVSSARATARRRVRRATEAAKQAAEHIAQQAAAAEELHAARTAWTDANPDVAAWLATSTGRFAESLTDTLTDTGALTEKQAAAVRKIITEHAADPDPAPVTEGRQVVTGRIISVKWVDGYAYGSSVRKMTVLDDRGFKVYGTAPAALDDAQRGARVTLTATLTASDDDETFGFFKRPTKAAAL